MIAPEALYSIHLGSVSSLHEKELPPPRSTPWRAYKRSLLLPDQLPGEHTGGATPPRSTPCKWPGSCIQRHFTTVIERDLSVVLSGPISRWKVDLIAHTGACSRPSWISCTATGNQLNFSTCLTIQPMKTQVWKCKQSVVLIYHMADMVVSYGSLWQYMPRWKGPN